MITTIIFDFDGVIHDTFDIAYTISKHFYPNLTIEGYKDLFNGNIYSNIEITPKIKKEFAVMQKKEFVNLEVKAHIKRDLLKLNENFDMFIVSSNWESHINLYLKNNSLNLFTKVLGLETHQSKVEKFKILLKKYPLRAKDCIFITDTLGDIKEANQVGIKTIAVDFGFHDKERLKKGNPYKVVSEFNEILSTIEEIKKL